MTIEKINGFWVPANDIPVKDWKAKTGVYAHFTQDKCFKTFLNYIKKRKKRFRTVLDIGAWCGTWSYEIQKYAERVIAFDPDKIHVQCLNKNLEQFDNCEIITKAVGNKKGTISLTDDYFTQGKRIEKEKGNIPITTIDSLEYMDVDLIKIDVVGYEMNVLKGAEQTLSTTNFLMIELNGNSKKYGSSNTKIEKYLKEIGFKTLINKWPDKVFIKK